MRRTLPLKKQVQPRRHARARNYRIVARILSARQLLFYPDYGSIMRGIIKQG
ncbi:MAG TPA: hypothetical protein VKB86_14525 [Pyrinomonadaceae bacterium]|nr:hypothetical protein [Pyrinomonadaceae bacterium]